MEHPYLYRWFIASYFLFMQTQEIRAINQEEFLRDRQEDEMEMSDNEEEGPAPKKARKPDEPGTLFLS